MRASALLAALALLPACNGGSGAGGAVTVQISGESLATDGIDFPAGGEAALSDGWEIRFSHVLVTVGRAWLSDNPDLAPSDQSQTGPTVALAAGPWAVDLHRAGSEIAAGGEGTAVLLTTIDMLDSGAALAPGDRHAFSYDLAAAAADAKIVNFDDDDDAKLLYKAAIANGYSVVYAGTATFKGVSCDTSDASYDFSRIPTEVPFVLGFATPTSYLNCQNQDNQGEPFEGEEYQRGVTIKAEQPSVAQITIHLEHPFYAALRHEPRLYFDQIAAQLVSAPAGTPVTMEQMIGVDPSAFRDADGAALPWRSCDGSSVPPFAQRYFDAGSVPIDPAAPPPAALRDYRDFMSYAQSTQGHMNGGEGICFAKRSYPCPP